MEAIKARIFAQERLADHSHDVIDIGARENMRYSAQTHGPTVAEAVAVNRRVVPVDELLHDLVDDRDNVRVEDGVGIWMIHRPRKPLRQLTAVPELIRATPASADSQPRMVVTHRGGVLDMLACGRDQSELREAILHVREVPELEAMRATIGPATPVYVPRHEQAGRRDAVSARGKRDAVSAQQWKTRTLEPLRLNKFPAKGPYGQAPNPPSLIPPLPLPEYVGQERRGALPAQAHLPIHINKLNNFKNVGKHLETIGHHT